MADRTSKRAAKVRRDNLNRLSAEQKITGATLDDYFLKDGTRRFRLRYRLNGQVKPSPSFDSPAAAALWWHAREIETIRFGAQVTVADVELTWRDYWPTYWVDYAGQTLADNTLDNYASIATNWVLPFWADRKVADTGASAALAVDFHNWLRAKNASTDLQLKAFSISSKFMAIAVRNGKAQMNPFRVIEWPKADVPDDITVPDPELVELMRAALLSSGSGNAWRDMIFYSLIAYAGLRPQEVVGLRWRHVIWADDELEIRWVLKGDDTVQHETKNRRKREVHMNAVLRRSLWLWWVRQGRPDGDVHVIPGAAKSRRVAANGRRKTPLPHLTKSQLKNWGRRDAYAPALERVLDVRPNWRDEFEDSDPYWGRHYFVSLKLREPHATLIEVADEAGDLPSTIERRYAKVIRRLKRRKKLSAGEQITLAQDAVSSQYVTWGCDKELLGLLP